MGVWPLKSLNTICGNVCQRCSNVCLANYHNKKGASIQKKLWDLQVSQRKLLIVEELGPFHSDSIKVANTNQSRENPQNRGHDSIESDYVALLVVCLHLMDIFYFSLLDCQNSNEITEVGRLLRRIQSKTKPI